MPFFTALSWKKIRGWLLAALILLFVAGVSYLFSTGIHVAPVSSQAGSESDGNFGQYLIEHYSLLAPFFDKNRQDVVSQGVPLLIKVMGDIILLNMAIGWILDIGFGMGFAFLFAPLHAKPQHAVLYASWRLGLDIIIFIMASFGAFGLEQMGSIIPFWAVLLIFLGIDILVQSFLVANIYGTGAIVSTVFYIILLVVHLLVAALISGSLIKTRVSVMLAQFVDVQTVTGQLQEATGRAKHDLDMAKGSKDEAQQAFDAAKEQLAQASGQQDQLLKDIEAKQNSESFVYGRIIRIRAQGDLLTARDQLNTFITKFPNGTLVNAAKSQIDLINQDLANQDALKRKAEADAVAAVAGARADLLAKAAKGEATLSDLRKALVGKKPADIISLFGPPSETASDRWGYSPLMVINPLTNEKFGLAVYFNSGVVQGVDYYYSHGSGETK